MQNQLADKDDVVSLTPGQQLRMAREAKGLTVDAVAKQLFVGKQLIAGLESDDYTKIGAPVYVRGHIVSYAKLLNITATEPLFTELTKFDTKFKTSQQVATFVPRVAPSTSQDKQRCGLFCVAVIIVIIALISFGYSYYKKYRLENNTNEVTTSISLDSEAPQVKTPEFTTEKPASTMTNEEKFEENAVQSSMVSDTPKDTTTTALQIPQSQKP